MPNSGTNVKLLSPIWAHSLMANNLRHLRDGRGWTQDQAAAALGTTRNQYAKLEGGSRRLSDKWIKLASDAYGVDPGEVVTERQASVPVAGFVGAGTEMHFYDEGQGSLDEAPAPEGVSAHNGRGRGQGREPGADLQRLAGLFRRPARAGDRRPSRPAPASWAWPTDGSWSRRSRGGEAAAPSTCTGSSASPCSTSRFSGPRGSHR